MSENRHEQINVLDHGFVRLVEPWGHGDAGEAFNEIEWSQEGIVRHGIFKSHPTDYECGIIEAARQSTQGSFRGWDHGDSRLLRFLFDNKPPHSTPFEFAGMTIEVQGPIFVFREWRTHRTAPQIGDEYEAMDEAYNEMSARYAPLPDLNYIPTVERIMMNKGSKNRQAVGAEGAAEITEQAARLFAFDLKDEYERLQYRYQRALDSGVPKELARSLIPVGRYSKMRATAFLRNWIAFVTLRSDPGAQWEIRQYSLAVEQILAKTFPRTYAMFVDQRSSDYVFRRVTDDRLIDELCRRGYNVTGPRQEEIS